MSSRKNLKKILAAEGLGERVTAPRRRGKAAAELVKLDRKQYLNLGYSQVIVGEPDEQRNGAHGTSIRVGTDWYSVHILWHPRQAKWQKPHASEALGVSPTIKLWGVRSKL